MNRREFITLLGGAAAAWPLAARGQQAKRPTIGFLGATTPSVWSGWVGPFERRLRELGWIEGRPSQSSIDGPKDGPSATPKSRLSLRVSLSI
jgi:hypothetical protein